MADANQPENAAKCRKSYDLKYKLDAVEYAFDMDTHWVPDTSQGFRSIVQIEVEGFCPRFCSNIQYIICQIILLSR